MGRMEQGRRNAMFSSLHGNMKRTVDRHFGEACGKDEGCLRGFLSG